MENMQDQDSWNGSVGHKNGNTKVYNLLEDPEEAVQCRRIKLYCQGIKTCEHIDPGILAGCKHYEPDKEDTKMLWTYELDANKREEGSAT